MADLLLALPCSNVSMECTMKLRILVACLFAVVPAWSAAQQPKVDAQAVARYSAAEVQAAVAKLRAIVQDGLSTEESMSEARRELAILQVRANELAAANSSKTDSPGPATALSLEVRNLLAAVDGKLGPTDAASNGRVLLPVPMFEDRRELSDLANALRTAQMNLRQQLRGANADAQKTETLLAEMIGAEERLAWAAGWPFTLEEAAEVRLLRTGTASDMDRRIVQLAGARRARGVARINQQLSQEADSVGRPNPPPFAVHRPTTQSGQRIVDRRLTEWLSTELGVKLPPDSPALTVLARGTRRFDQAATSALLGR
jgi:hypothetical protein